MTTKTIPYFLQHVVAQLGQHEQPLGSNDTRYGAQFGWNKVSWCVEYGWDMYSDCDVVLPLKTASCVAIWDAAARIRLTYPSTAAVPGDSIIRTWEHLPRASLNPQKTHFQVVVGTHTAGGVKYLDLIGGNQGPGVVSRDIVRAGDASVLGAMAFHTLFSTPTLHGGAVRDDVHTLPASKSHKYPTAFLSLGSHGDLVRKLQHLLQSHGFYRGYVVDGAFGPHTLAAVVAYQRSRRLLVDGIVGPKTYAALGF